MKGLIRWSYVAPRLFGLIVAVSVVWFGLDPAVRWTLVFTGQAITGTRVEIDRLDTSISGCRMNIDGLQIASPKSPDSNLLDAQSVQIELDAGELLRRRMVVREGKISGVRLNRPRDSSGELERSRLRFADGMASRLGDQGAHLLKTLALAAVDGPITANWEVVTVSQELIASWRAEYADLALRVDRLHDRTIQLRDLVESRRFDSMADVGRVQDALTQAQQLRAELAELRAEGDRLRARAPLDQQRLLTAKDHDVQRIERIVKLAQLDGPTLTEYLLGPEYAGRAREFVSWIQWGRQYVPVRRDIAAPTRMRGQVVRFPGTARRPRLLIESLAIEGQVDLDGGPLRLNGTARDLTTEPAKLGRPAYLEFVTGGVANLQIQALVDRTGTEPVDRLRVRCPSHPQSDHVLGRPDQLALSIAPANLQWDLVIDLRGESLSGNLLISQSSLDIVPYVGEKYGGERMAKRLWTTTKAIDSIDVTVHLSGTLQDPSWKLESNLGPQLVDGINQVVQEEVVRRQRQLAASLDETWNEQLARVRDQLNQQTSGWDNKLAMGQSQIDQLKNRLVERIGLPLPTEGLGDLPARLGRSLPGIGGLLDRSR